MSISTQITVAATAETIIVTAPGALRGPMGDVTPEVVALVSRAETAAEGAGSAAASSEGFASQANEAKVEADSSAEAAEESAAQAAASAAVSEGSATTAVNGLKSDLANPAIGASIIVTAGGATVNQELAAQDKNIAYREKYYRDVVLNKTNENRNWIYPWGGRGVTILGDSISHMAFSREAYINNWTNIMKRCVNAEFDSTSYGFVSLLATLGSGSTLSREIHTVTRSGTWSELTLGQCEWSVSGFALESSVAASSLLVSVPSFQSFFGVWYHSFPGGGVFEVLTNGVVSATVDTNGNGGSMRTSALNIGAMPISDGGKGLCSIELRVVSGTVRLMGISYENRDFDHQVSNFSQSGRQLRWVSKDVIQKCVKGSTSFILALGYNDNAAAEADPDYLDAIKDRINWIIAEAITYGVKVYVLDFVWIRAQTRAIPTELKRCADSIPGATYIRFADYLKTNGGLADGSWLINNIRLFDDAAHPNILGHKFVAEIVCKSMGLGVCTKKQALSYYDWWMPVRLTGNLKNTFTAPYQLTAYKRQGSFLNVRIYLFNDLVNNATTAVPAGTYDFILGADLPSDIWLGNTSFYPLAWSTAQDETVTPYVSGFLESRLNRNGMRIIVKATTKRNIDGTALIPVFKNATEV